MPLSYEQHDILENIKKVWEREPGLRFCQLVDNVADAYRHPAPEWAVMPASDDTRKHCIFFTSDKDFRSRLEDRLEVRNP